MGAIQEAFNQGLAISALAFSPEVARRNNIRTTEKIADQAEDQAKYTSYKRFLEKPISGHALDVLGDEGLLNPDEPLIVIDRYAETAKTAYETNPTAKNRYRYAQSTEWQKIAKDITEESLRREEMANKAADKVAAAREQYKDQIEMLHSIAEGVRWGSTQPNKKDKGGAK